MKTVFVLLDSLNRNAMECYGSTTVHTPNFVRFAKRAVRFDNHYVGSIPARRDLHTGRLNFLHRGWKSLEPFDDSFPELLKQQGTYSHIITDHHHYFADGGATYHPRFSSWELGGGTLANPFSFTKRVLIMKLKPQSNTRGEPVECQGMNFEDTATRLYDLETDPGQKRPINAPEIAAWLVADMIRHMRDADAPEELYTRFNLEEVLADA